MSQYPGGDYEGIARNAYGLRGSASVLLELSAIDDEQSQIRSAYVAMLAVVQTAADGSLTGWTRPVLTPSRRAAIRYGRSGAAVTD